MGSYKFIHTADWHLGRQFHRADLCPLQGEFLAWLADLAERESADAVLMAGDIYDRALPPVAAVEVFRRGVAELADRTNLVMITGNHDSNPRMALGELLRPEIELRAGAEEVGRPVMFGGAADPGGGDADAPGGNRTADVRGGQVAVYPIPYLDPILDAAALGAEEHTHEAVLGAALDRCRADLESRPEGTRAVVIAHAFVSGGAVSESERTLAVGGAEQVPAGLFDGFDYVALGHLHRPQSVAGAGAGIGDGDGAVAYAGSPIPYSFSEVAREDAGRGGASDGSDDVRVGESGEPGAPVAGKSVAVIELDRKGGLTVRTVEVPVFKPVARLEGELEELLSDSRFAAFEDHWLEVTLTDSPRPHNPIDRLRARFPDVLSLRFAENPLARESDGAERLARLTQRDPNRLAADFLEHVRGEGPSAAEAELLREAIASG